jgi:hypothetical protein
VGVCALLMQGLRIWYARVSGLEGLESAPWDSVEIFGPDPLLWSRIVSPARCALMWLAQFGFMVDVVGRGSHCNSWDPLMALSVCWSRISRLAIGRR